MNADETAGTFGLHEAEAALSGLRDMLNADGYDLSLSISASGTLGLEVIAGPDACAECLVPKDPMAGIAMDALAARSPCR